MQRHRSQLGLEQRLLLYNSIEGFADYHSIQRNIDSMREEEEGKGRIEIQRVITVAEVLQALEALMLYYERQESPGIAFIKRLQLLGHDLQKQVEEWQVGKSLVGSREISQRIIEFRPPGFNAPLPTGNDLFPIDEI